MLRRARGLAATFVVAAALSVAGVMLVAPAAQADGLVGCTHTTRLVACYENVWVDGVEVRMTFPQAGVPVHTVPGAKVQDFYVLAPQTSTAQGETPGFFHDHVIESAPDEPGYTPFMHGYLVLCSAQGISTGACTFNMETPPGGAPIPLVQAVTGYDLTTAAAVQAAADAGLVVLVDTGAVFIGTVTGH
jgi:hypothetical protein